MKAKVAIDKNPEGTIGRQIMNTTMTINREIAKENAVDIMGRLVMKRTKEVVATAMDVLREVRHNWVEAEGYRPHQ